MSIHACRQAPVFNRGAAGQYQQHLDGVDEPVVDTTADAFLNWMVTPRNTLDGSTIDALVAAPAAKAGAAAASASSTRKVQQECGRLLVERCVEVCSKRARLSAPNSAAKDTVASGSWLAERYAAILSATSRPSAEELALPGVYPTTTTGRTSGGKAKLDSVRAMVRATSALFWHYFAPCLAAFCTTLHAPTYRTLLSAYACMRAYRVLVDACNPML